MKEDNITNNIIAGTIMIITGILLIITTATNINQRNQIKELNSALRGCQKYVYHLEELTISEYALGRLKSVRKQPFIYKMADRHPSLKKMIMQVDSIKEKKHIKIPSPSNLPNIK